MQRLYDAVVIFSKITDRTTGIMTCKPRIRKALNDDDDDDDDDDKGRYSYESDKNIVLAKYWSTFITK
ncbi:hypothetical protein PoB_005697700 [Plakobranchus ocellatus]|uniref:Uncharacterized protein n=1 Tax=Plakobranchus ocellatus TaxID=259542 RepID=A0AAV4CGG1_9GAST|nr:hypothetical protein PoB_005697700 [Plakobranchus ocellatus]